MAHEVQNVSFWFGIYQMKHKKSKCQIAYNNMLAEEKIAIMENVKIKTEYEEMQLQIRKAEQRIKELQTICKHPNTHKGNYSYRIGAVSPATICDDCNYLLNWEI